MYSRISIRATNLYKRKRSIGSRGATSGDTPLWLRISSKVPVNRERMLNRMPPLSDHISPGSFTVPIHLRPGVEYQTVVDDVVRLVKEIAGMVDKP